MNIQVYLKSELQELKIDIEENNIIFIIIGI